MAGSLSLVSIILFVAVHHVASHSWLACVDYTEKNGGDWDPEKCRGFARNSATYAKKDAFGSDRGFDHKPGQSGNACKTTKTDQSYSTDYPNAIYYPGQQVVLVHPMKNHGAATCTNIYIPDFGSAVYRGNVDTDTDQIYSYYADKLVADLGTSPFGSANTAPDTYPKQGYQNAPNFCGAGGTDKAMGTYSFNVPTDIVRGWYTFVWSWKFNGDQDIYSGCFDIVIADTKAARDLMLQARDSSIDLSVPCGGETSDGSSGSDAGCSTDPTTTKATTPPTTPVTTPATTPPTTTPATTPPTTTPATTPATTKSTTKVITETPVTISTTTGVYTTPTVSTIEPTDPTVTSKKTTTEEGGVEGDYCLPVMGHQFTGSIDIGVPPTSIKRRYLVIDFYCDVESISLWSGRVAEEHGSRKYEIIQDLPNDVARGMVDFFVSYENCDFSRYQPTAKLLWED